MNWLSGYQITAKVILCPGLSGHSFKIEWRSEWSFTLEPQPTMQE